MWQEIRHVKQFQCVIQIDYGQRITQYVSCNYVTEIHYRKYHRQLIAEHVSCNLITDNSLQEMHHEV